METRFVQHSQIIHKTQNHISSFVRLSVLYSVNLILIHFSSSCSLRSWWRCWRCRTSTSPCGTTTRLDGTASLARSTWIYRSGTLATPRSTTTRWHRGYDPNPCFTALLQCMKEVLAICVDSCMFWIGLGFRVRVTNRARRTNAPVQNALVYISIYNRLITFVRMSMIWRETGLQWASIYISWWPV